MSISIDDVSKLFGVLPDPLKEVLEEVMDHADDLKPIFDIIGEGRRGKLANSFGHQIVHVLKHLKMDSENYRKIVKTLLISWFDLDDEWIPKWPLVPA